MQETQPPKTFEDWMKLKPPLLEATPKDILFLLGVLAYSLDGQTLGGFAVDCVAKDCLEKLEGAPWEPGSEITLVRATNIELGFRDGALVSKTYARANEFGLVRCPQWTAPVLRMHYGEEQPKGERLHIAMEPIRDMNGRLSLFKVSHIDRQLLLTTDDGELREWYPGDTRWVFARHKSPFAGHTTC